MSRLEYTIAVTAFAVIVLLGMWLGWRARAKRDAGARLPAAPLSGEVLAEFARISYVSTTFAGQPFERVAIPGLRYKGFADLVVRRDGVAFTVTGEPTVSLTAAQVLGTGTAQGRAGKAVERDGLTLVRWTLEDAPGGPREVESSFRLADPDAHRRLVAAIDRLPDRGRTGGRPAAPQTSTTQNTTQEDA